MEPGEIAAGGIVRLPEDRGTGVWRYMDLAKFVSMLDSRAIHFARADLLGDPWEGSLSPSGLAARPAIAEGLAGVIPGWTPEMFESMLAQTGVIRMREVMVSCWHMANGESAAMWGLYTLAGKGVAVRSTVARLIEALPPQIEDSAITLSMVNYVDYNRFPVADATNIFVPLLFKRESFSHERELRAMLTTVTDPPCTRFRWTSRS